MVVQFDVVHLSILLCNPRIVFSNNEDDKANGLAKTFGQLEILTEMSVVFIGW